ncbi:MAG TPA: signal recognition particle protein, partial [Caulobacteraceae bacterium]|nr:signal recognition particle protein [Caulobacteraceae bacterium]
RLLKQHRQMQDAVKMMSRGGGKGLARMAGMFAGGGMDPLKALGGVAARPPVLPGLGGGPAANFNPFKKS